MSQVVDHVSMIYLTINRERIPVSESVIKAVHKENNHVRYIARREQRCAQPNYSLCRGDCQLCRWKCMGIIENFEEAEARYNLVDDTDIEADFLLKDTINEIMQFANKVTESGATLLTMHYMQHRSKREIARLMHIPASTGVCSNFLLSCVKTKNFFSEIPYQRFHSIVFHPCLK